MSVTVFPEKKSADSFYANYWFVRNPARPDIEALRVVHGEADTQSLMSKNLEGSQFGLFIPETVAAHLGFQLPDVEAHIVIDPEGNKGPRKQVGPVSLQWGGTLSEQEERAKYPGALPEPHSYSDISAYVWNGPVFIGLYRNVDA